MEISYPNFVRVSAEAFAVESGKITYFISYIYFSYREERPDYRAEHQAMQEILALIVSRRPRLVSLCCVVSTAGPGNDPSGEDPYATLRKQTAEATQAAINAGTKLVSSGRREPRQSPS